MSHFTQVKTQIKEMEMLKKALEALGMEFTEAKEGEKLMVKGWEDRSVEAELSINPGCSYGIAVTTAENGYELNADWWAIETYTGKTREKILGSIEKQYAYETVMDKVRKQGYSVVTEEESSESIKLVVRRWV
ncbi:DUF1257 domain-containing protein [Sediminispirochaeta bajacaliforniensis]|uniref:DUF1257 domain-containing protein n=1 Tax=Sediminispirochaeta bajacaliforniensis TaxID=148 RepID=UPI00037CB4B5|nr:DUF1257 domain-containing protein [Sediminispirochaeta bajacaliforniensis]